MARLVGQLRLGLPPPACLEQPSADLARPEERTQAWREWPVGQSCHHPEGRSGPASLQPYLVDLQ